MILSFNLETKVAPLVLGFNLTTEPNSVVISPLTAEVISTGFPPLVTMELRGGLGYYESDLGINSKDMSINLNLHSSVLVDLVLTNPMLQPPEVSNASVKLTVLDANEKPLTDVNWPVTLNHISGGQYSLLIPPLESLNINKPYYFIIEVEGPNGLKGYFRNKVNAKYNEST